MRTSLITRNHQSRPRTHTSPARLFSLLAAGIVLFLFACLPLISVSCVSTPEELAHWDQTYQGITNATATYVQPVIQAVPPPWNAVAEAALGLFSAGLATWNVQQHRRLAILEAAAPATPPGSPGSP